MGTEKIDTQNFWKRIWRFYPDKTKVKGRWQLSHRIWHIRPIIVITFDTTSVLVHNGTTFGAVIGVGSRDCDKVVPCQDIVAFSTVSKRYR